MVQFNIKIEGLDKLKKGFTRAGSSGARELNNAIRKSTFILQGDVKEKTPVDTGNLRSKIYTKFAPLTGKVYTNVKYAKFIEKGTRSYNPDIIRPRVYKIRGRTIVRHRTKGRMFGRAIKATRIRINRNFKIAIDKILKMI